MVKSTCPSCRGPGFKSPHPLGSSQSSITAAPGDPKSSFELQSSKYLYMWFIYIYASKTLKHTNESKVKYLKNGIVVVKYLKLRVGHYRILKG